LLVKKLESLSPQSRVRLHVYGLNELQRLSWQRGLTSTISWLSDETSTYRTLYNNRPQKSKVHKSTTSWQRLGDVYVINKSITNWNSGIWPVYCILIQYTVYSILYSLYTRIQRKSVERSTYLYP